MRTRKRPEGGANPALRAVYMRRKLAQALIETQAATKDEIMKHARLADTTVRLWLEENKHDIYIAEWTVIITSDQRSRRLVPKYRWGKGVDAKKPVLPPLSVEERPKRLERVKQPKAPKKPSGPDPYNQLHDFWLRWKYASGKKTPQAAPEREEETLLV